MVKPPADIRERETELVKRVHMGLSLLRCYDCRGNIIRNEPLDAEQLSQLLDKQDGVGRAMAEGVTRYGTDAHKEAALLTHLTPLMPNTLAKHFTSHAAINPAVQIQQENNDLLSQLRAKYPKAYADYMQWQDSPGEYFVGMQPAKPETAPQVQPETAARAFAQAEAKRGKPVYFPNDEVTRAQLGILAYLKEKKRPVKLEPLKAAMKADRWKESGKKATYNPYKAGADVISLAITGLLEDAYGASARVGKPAIVLNGSGEERTIKITLEGQHAYSQLKGRAGSLPSETSMGLRA